MLFDYGFVCLGMRANAPILDAVRKEFEDEDVEIMNIGEYKNGVWNGSVIKK